MSSAIRRPRHCSACHQPGHNRNNRTCPLFQRVERTIADVPPRNDTISSSTWDVPPRNVTIRPTNHDVPPRNVTIRQTNVVFPPRNVTIRPANAVVQPRNANFQPRRPATRYTRHNRLDLCATDMLTRLRSIKHIVSTIKDNVYKQLIENMFQVYRPRVNPIMNTLSSCEQLIRILNSQITDKKNIITEGFRTYLSSRIFSLENTLRPIIISYMPILDVKLLSIGHPGREYYIKIKRRLDASNRDKLDIDLSLMSIDSTKEDCPICLDNKNITIMCSTNCSHKFCVDCVNTHLSQTKAQNKTITTCPMCRTVIKDINVYAQDQVSILLKHCMLI